MVMGSGNQCRGRGRRYTSALIPNLAPAWIIISGWRRSNSGGESMPSETVGCRIPAFRSLAGYLLSTASRALTALSTCGTRLAPENYKPPGHDQNTGGTERVLPRRVNSFDYVVAHGRAISAVSQMAFDSCQVRAVTNGTVALNNYNIVLWNAGNQSTKDRTFQRALKPGSLLSGLPEDTSLCRARMSPTTWAANQDQRWPTANF